MVMGEEEARNGKLQEWRGWGMEWTIEEWVCVCTCTCVSGWMVMGFTKGTQLKTQWDLRKPRSSSPSRHKKTGRH